MKLGRRAITLLGIVVAVLLLGAVYMLYSRQARAYGEAQSGMSAAQANFLKAINSRKTIETQIAQSQEELEKTLASLEQANAELSQSAIRFPGTIDNTDYMELLFILSQEHDLEISGLTISKPTETIIDEITYSAVKLSFGVSGTMPDIFDFLLDIASDEAFSTAAIENLGVTAPEAASAGAPSAVNLSLTIYGRQ
ncbi:MAG: hypothetical protein HY670_10360 [Chloroflexi bacterium]|nr:hypothetical protein [Chloroflexota bacterium]